MCIRAAFSSVSLISFCTSTYNMIADLLSWYKQHGRHHLPWRKTRDQYKILISELMLQQTQVPRVHPKYEAFITAFPTMESLANADRAKVLQFWQGLGYNSRAVRLHALAKVITSQRNGKLPTNRDELLALPGIGPYTAGALVIFGQRKPAASVDVNIERVLKRVFYKPSQLPTKKDVEALQLRLITESGRPHDFHAALMDLGSAICTARAPKCNECPLYKRCNTRGVRPDEIRTVPKQSQFLGSVRWWRGQILKVLLAGPVAERHLIYRIKQQPGVDDQEQFDKALSAMTKEGLIALERKLLRLR
jgi:A/G-specific adenine glycosylase